MTDAAEGALLRIRLDVGTNGFRDVVADRLSFEDGNLRVWLGNQLQMEEALTSVADVSIDVGVRSYVAAVRLDRPRAHSKWSPDEEAQLRELFAAGRSIGEIARELGRRDGGVRSRLIRLGLVERPTDSDHSA